MSGNKRIIDFPTSGAYDGYLLQDKMGGITSKVARGTVAAGLKAEGLAGSPDLASQVDTAKGAGLIGWLSQTVGFWLDMVLRNEVNVLRFIPRTEWDAIRANTSTYDCLTAFNQARDSAWPGQRIRIPSGRYRISGTWEITKQLRIVGDSTGVGGDGSQIYRTGDFIALYIHGVTATQSYISFGGIENLNIGGVEGTADFFKMDLCLGGSYDNLVINGSTSGAFMRIARSQDFALYRPFFRHTNAAHGTEGLLVFDPPDTTITDNSCNDIRVIGGHLEHSGPLVRSKYTSGAGRNNTVVFTNTKLESGGYAGPLVILDTVDRWVFDPGCRYNQYVEQVFSVTNSDACVISGVPGRNSSAPSIGFGTFTNCTAFKFQLVGNLIGRIARVNCTRFKIECIQNARITMDADAYGIDAAAFGTGYLQYFSNQLNGLEMEADAAEYCGEAIKGHTINDAPLIALRVAPSSYHKDGMHFLVRAKSSAGTPTLNVKAISFATGLDVSLGTISLTTTYAWSRINIPPDIAGTRGMLIYILNNTMGGNRAYISEWKFGDGTYGTAAPTTGTWTTFAKSWNSAPAAGGKIGWVCVTGGSPGTWKAWGPIDA